MTASPARQREQWELDVIARGATPEEVDARRAARDDYLEALERFVSAQRAIAQAIARAIEGRGGISRDELLALNTRGFDAETDMRAGMRDALALLEKQHDAWVARQLEAT